jgi:hypothetical protein
VVVRCRLNVVIDVVACWRGLELVDVNLWMCTCGCVLVDVYLWMLAPPPPMERKGHD